jgi:hypothetical protein
MNKKIGLLAFALILSMFTMSGLNLSAYLESEIVPQPDVMCDPNLGCLISEYVEDISYNVVWYNQRLTSNPDYRTIYMHTDFGITHCSSNIYNEGCAVASMTMLLNYYRGYSTQVVSLTSVNNTVENSCNYSYTHFEEAYPNDVLDKYIDSTWYTNKSTILALIGPKIFANQLAILGVRNSAGATHFVVVSGYTRTVKEFENDTVYIYTELKIKDPANNNRNTLSLLLADYPTVYRIHVYEDIN